MNKKHSMLRFVIEKTEGEGTCSGTDTSRAVGHLEAEGWFNRDERKKTAI